MTASEQALIIAQSAAAALFALPVGTTVKCLLSDDSEWTGKIVKGGPQGCDLVGKRNGTRSIVRNRNTGAAYMIVMSGSRGRDFLVMAVQAL